MTAPSRLIDTDVAIEVLRGRTPALDARVAAEPAPRISAITVAELVYGTLRSPRPSFELLGAFQEIVPALPLDAEAAARAAEVRAALARAGTPIGHYDTLIAGHALALGVPLVTRNAREFERVPGLAVEAW